MVDLVFISKWCIAGPWSGVMPVKYCDVRHQIQAVGMETCFMEEKKKRKIILEDGREFYGEAFGASGDRVCEIVFNTSMAGYQEILSDLSYTDQAVVMTYPLIGNYGMAAEDYESITPSIGALIVRQYQDEPSNFRSSATLGEVMAANGIPGISGVDTRALTRSIRDYGTRKALLTDAETPPARGTCSFARDMSSDRCCLTCQLQRSLDQPNRPACISLSTSDSFNPVTPWPLSQWKASSDRRH